MSRAVVTVVLAVVGGLVLGVAGVMVGALRGGNFASDSQPGDARGYEATRQPGGLLGLASGCFWARSLGKRHPGTEPIVTPVTAVLRANEADTGEETGMVTRRRLLLLVGLLTAWALGLGLVWFLRAPGRISAASCARIQPGMTKAEVGAILGETDDWVGLDTWGGRHSAYYHDYGSGRRATIEVRFDENDRVFDKAFEEESVEAWLSRRWRN